LPIIWQGRGKGLESNKTDAQKENKTKLVEVWNNIKQDKQEHLDMLKNCLENEVEKGELNNSQPSEIFVVPNFLFTFLLTTLLF
jgi:hypothetical protein